MRRRGLIYVVARFAAAAALLALGLISANSDQGASAATLLTTSVTVSGTINGETLAGTGIGTMDLDTGVSHYVSVFSSIPTGFDVIAYGKSHKTKHHPKHCLEMGGAANLSTLSPAGYDVDVTQTYDNGDVIVATAQVRQVSASEDSYTMDLQGTYTGRTDAVNILPGVERLTSMAPGIVRGMNRDTIVFADSSTIRFTRVATYTLLNPTAVLPFHQQLRVTVDGVVFDPATSTLELDTTAICEPAPTGGIVELPVGQADSPASAAEGSGSSAPPYAVIGGAAAAALVALGAGGWYASRRWIR